ncbi:craniofacial development protein 2, partial [Biomphalaria glabrata]
TLQEEYVNFRDCPVEFFGKRRGSYKLLWKLIDERKDAKRRRDQKNATQDRSIAKKPIAKAMRSRSE